ncbi:protein singles bar-like [Stegodyphus dumicola]|uniref:protein singles bar-like n=1 Tax=Stegodyphus dumicola TaxID=202533 RepID=UPI0015B1AC91|nr:protein singles bar-like [Stegodyphus dumicola]
MNVMQTTIPITRTQVVTQRKACCALYTDFLTTQPGLCKLGELLFGGICVGLMITYGSPMYLTLGVAYPLFLVNSSAALLFASVTLFCYLISEHTFRVIRTTILEIVQNIVAAILYSVGSAFLIMHTTLFLWPMYIIIPYFQAYPALMTAGVRMNFSNFSLLFTFD